MTEFRMPSLGADMEAGTLVEWLVKPGDTVRRGDVVAIVETQKGAIEIEIFNAGVVSALLVPIGSRVPVGTVLARLDAEVPALTSVPSTRADAPVHISDDAALGAMAAKPQAPARGPSPAKSWPRSHDVHARSPTSSDRAPTAAPVVAGTGAPTPAAFHVPSVPDQRSERRRVSPAARRIAAERGIDLAVLTGSGSGGAILVVDVEAAARPPAPARRRTGFDPAAMRQAVAAAVSRSKREIPHYYLSQTIDVSPALAGLEARNRDRPPTARVLPAALFLRAIAGAMAKTPDLNGFWEDGQFHRGDGVHVGWAIALRGGGLVAPAIRDADRLTLDELMTALRDLVARARSSGLRGSELTAATVTVTSLGDRGAESVWPVIFPPQVAMIGLGRVVNRPWVVEDGVQPRQIVTITLAGDHRASDGHRGGLLLAEIETLLREPLET